MRKNYAVVTEEERFARFALHQTGVPPAWARSLLVRFGGASAAIREKGKISGAAGRGPWARNLDALRDPGREWERLKSRYQTARNKGWKFWVEEELVFIFSGVAEADLPFGLWSHGLLEGPNLSRPRVAIVGTRSPTPYGRMVCEEFAKALAARGAGLVSGLAYGIDRLAHEAALHEGAGTWAVLGTGLDRVYPAAHRVLQEERIPSQGAVLSEWPLGAGPERHQFPARNRLIAGLSLAVLVVEGDDKSGALITARCAAEQGKDVFAVPGSIYSAMSRAPNRLIREGAVPVTCAEDVISALPALSALTCPRTAPFPSISAAQRKVLDVLTREPMGLEEVLKGTGLDLSLVSQALVELEIGGYISDMPPHGYVKRAALEPLAVSK